MDYISLSGGIDSTALALMMPTAQLIFADTGDEFPELYAHLDKFESVTRRKVIRIQGRVVKDALVFDTLPEYEVRSHFLPGHGSRYCTRMFKVEPINWYLKQHLPATLCIGLRADEDERVGNLTDLDGLSIRYPLRESGLSRMDCIKLCLEHDLLPRYPAYMLRGGCKGCFYKRTAEVKAMAQLVPDVMAELNEREKAVQDERGSFALMFPNVGKSVAQVMSQPALFDMSELYIDALDQSDVGANCGAFCRR